jgi:hypothetical protein
MLRPSHAYRIGLTLACLAATACGDANLLPPATLGVRDDTITLWAVTDTPIQLPSAWDLVLGISARTDRTSAFDMVFDFVYDSLAHDTVPALLPRGALGLSADGGLQRMPTAFDSLFAAPVDGYDSYKTIPLDSTTVVVIRSRSQTCNFDIYSGIFAKAVPLAISRADRKIILRLVTDPNCGYHSFRPGVPGN